MNLQPWEFDKLHKKIEEVYEIETPDEFPKKALFILSQLISSDHCNYNEIHHKLASSPGKPMIKAVPLPEIPLPQTILDALPRYIHQHPTIKNIDKTLDGAPYKISDFLSKRAFHRLDLYQEFYRHMDAEYQINFYLMSRQDYLIGIALTRRMKDFSEEERQMLSLIHPHLVRAYRNVLSNAYFRKTKNVLEGVIEQDGKGIIEVNWDGTIRSITDLARHLLVSYFGVTAQSLARLPLLLQKWIETHQGGSGKEKEVPSRTYEQEGKVLYSA